VEAIMTSRVPGANPSNSPVEETSTRREFLATTVVGAAAVVVGCTGASPGEADGLTDGLTDGSQDDLTGAGTTDGQGPEATSADADTVKGADSAAGADADTVADADAGVVADADATADSDGSLPDAPTPECLETEDNALGPAYVDGAPLREAGELNVLDWPGTVLTISGQVSGLDCEVIPGAKLDLWQADAAGCYNGSRIGCDALDPDWPLRGLVNADSEGKYSFSTIYPGVYPGRTRHIHLTVRAVGYKTLTTQIYFAGVPENAIDGLIEAPLIIELEEGLGGALSGEFPIVLVAL
jgi:protocatechuate 3,4-dioxygenase beta subunit